MTTNIPDAGREDSRSGSTQELPSSRTLLRSTAIAAVTALVLLITVVLPAEYGVDPTGIGRVLGLTRMGEIKVALAKEAAAAAAADSVNAGSASAASAQRADSASAVRANAGPATPSTPATASNELTHETRITLRPGEGKEVKLVMRR